MRDVRIGALILTKTPAMKLSRFVASLALAPALVGAQTTLSTPG